jgi:hypothetical protein
MKRDADGLERVDLEWSIEGRNGTRRGKMHELHAQEVVNAKRSIKDAARRGDTVTIREI